MRSHAVVALALALVALACGDALDPDDPRPPADGGLPLDAGFPPDAGESPDGGDPVDAGPTLGPVVHSAFSFEPATGKLRTRLTLAPEAGAECLRLASALDPAPLTLEGAPEVTVARRGEVLELCGQLPARFALDATTTVPLSRLPGTQVGFSRTPDAEGRTFTYLLGWVGECARFGPCDPHPARLGHFSFDVTHGAGEVVLCPGRRTADSPTRTRCELSGTAAPTYSAMGIAMHPAWAPRPLTTAAGVRVVLFEAAGGRVGDALPAEDVARFLRWITGKFGPFPYGDELRVATGPTSWLGMEHPANVVLAETVVDLRGYYRRPALHALLHEIAHHWAGNRTTLADVLDFGWKEAVSEYLVYAWQEAEGLPGEADETRRAWHRDGRFAAYPVRPRSDPGVPLSAWSGATYAAGPLALFVQLEPFLGREVILRALAAFLSEPEARSMTDLRRALEAASGTDLRRWFAAWIEGDDEPIRPRFVATTAAVPGGTEVKLVQETDGLSPFPVAVEVLVETAAGAAQALVSFGLDPQVNQASAVVPVAGEILRVRIDPDDRVLDWTPGGRLAGHPLRWHP